MNKKVMSALALGVLLCSGVALAQSQDRHLDQTGVGQRLGPPDFGPLGGAGETCATPNAPFGAAPTSVQSTIPIAGASDVVNNVDVSIQIDHTWVGDVLASLTHGATSSLLIDRIGVPALGACGCAGDDIDVTLSDSGAPSVEDVCAAAIPSISGTLSPSPGTLAVFDNADPNGNWTLTVTDGVPTFDNGTFLGWCVDLTVGPPTTTGGTAGTGGTGGTGTSTPATSVWGVMALIALFLGVSVFFLRRRSSASA
jgi:subtilisin-like proprotein convertase family protein